MRKELEALNGLAQFIIMNDTGTDESASAIEWHGILKQALTPPTADEVCEALNEWYKDKGGFKIEYDKSKMCFYDIKGGDVIARFNTVLVTIFKSLPLRLITLIGRFYEGVVR